MSKPKPLSIKLIDSEEPEPRFYETNYCNGICGNAKHRENRTTITFTQYIENEEFDVSEALSFDMSCTHIRLDLLQNIKVNSPQVECIFIQEAHFDLDAWIYFVDEFAPRLVNFGVGNTIKIWTKVWHEEEGKEGEDVDCVTYLTDDSKLRLPKLLKLPKMFRIEENPKMSLSYLFENMTQIQEIQSFIDETVKTDCKRYADSFKALKSSVLLYLRHKSGEQCFATDCNCKYEQAPIQLMSNDPDIKEMSYFNQILFHLKENRDMLNSVGYLRIDSDVCQYQAQITAYFVSSFNQLIALHLNLFNRLFDGLDREEVFTVFKPLFSKQFPRLDSLAGALGDHSVQSLVYSIPKPFGKTIENLKLYRGEFEIEGSDVKLMYPNCENVISFEMDQIKLSCLNKRKRVHTPSILGVKKRKISV